MATLPTLPGCGQPATIRVEIYSAADGQLHGSLDGSVYACEQHGIEMVSAIQAAGFTAHRMPGGDVKRCGDGLDFTGTTPRPLTAPTKARFVSNQSALSETESVSRTYSPESPEHPVWCDRGTTCRIDGTHHSRPLPATTAAATAPMRVWLEQVTRPAVGAPMLVLEVAEQGEPRYYWLPVEQGRVLAYQVRRLVDLSKVGQR